MTQSKLSIQVARLKQQFESRLGWGASHGWTSYDFEKLNELISEKTGISLSVSTLKRIFGKVNYNSDPSLTTLNALAQYMDYADWRDFQSKNQDKPAEIIETKPPPSWLERIPRHQFRNLALVLLVLAALVFLSFFLVTRKPAYDPRDFSFSSKTLLTEGLPNSVVFDFDASQAREGDTVFVCQTWDIRRKVMVNKNDKHHSAIYYYPGFFKAKLMIGTEILREHDIQIKTDGWLGLIEAEWGIPPLYFKKEEIDSAGEISISEALLKKYNVDLLPTPPNVRFYNQKDIRGINTDNFIFETTLKSSFAEGPNACQRVEILVHAKNDILIVPLCNVACAGDLYVAAYGQFSQSKNEDLSGFGCNLSDWTTLRVECKNGDMSFMVNDKTVFKTKIKNSPTEIVGLQYRFIGPGAVKDAWIEGGSGRIVF